ARERVDGRADPKVDAVREPRLGPVAARHVGPLLGDVAGDEDSVRWKGAADADRRVAREGAELEGAAGADRAAEEPHERPLLGGDLHDRAVRALLGVVREALEQLVGRAGV